jgi:hypothetical protein
MTYPTQGVNDDEFFAQLVSGEFTGRRESFIHISPASPQWIFGFLVTKLYLISTLLYHIRYIYSKIAQYNVHFE